MDTACPEKVSWFWPSLTPPRIFYPPPKFLQLHTNIWLFKYIWLRRAWSHFHAGLSWSHSVSERKRFMRCPWTNCVINHLANYPLLTALHRLLPWLIFWGLPIVLSSPEMNCGHFPALLASVLSALCQKKSLRWKSLLLKVTNVHWRRTFGSPCRRRRGRKDRTVFLERFIKVGKFSSHISNTDLPYRNVWTSSARPRKVRILSQLLPQKLRWWRQKPYFRPPPTPPTLPASTRRRRRCRVATAPDVGKQTRMESSGMSETITALAHLQALVHFLFFLGVVVVVEDRQTMLQRWKKRGRGKKEDAGGFSSTSSSSTSSSSPSPSSASSSASSSAAFSSALSSLVARGVSISLSFS